MTETDTGHEQEAGRAFGQVVRISLAMATQLAQQRARVRERREQELERTAREKQAAAEAAMREQSQAEAARARAEQQAARDQQRVDQQAARDQERAEQQAARDKVYAERDAARQQQFEERERRQTSRRIAEYQLNRVDRDTWWENATPDKIATAYRQAQEWRAESGPAINAAEVIEARVGKDKGLDLTELSEDDLDAALAEAYMTPRERAQRAADRQQEQAQAAAGSDQAIAHTVAASLVADADREDAQVDAELDADGGPTHTPVELSPVAAKAREDIRAMLAGKQPRSDIPAQAATASEHPETEVVATAAELAEPVAATTTALTGGPALTGGKGLDAAAADLAAQRPPAYDSSERREETEEWLREYTEATDEAIEARMSADRSSAHPPHAATRATPAKAGKANTTGQVRNLTATQGPGTHQSR